MSYEVVAATSFEKRLDEAVRHRLLSNGRRSAAKLVASVERVSSLLANSPRLGKLLRIERVHAPRLRWVLVENYVIVYSVNDEDSTILLEDLFAGGANWRQGLE